MYTFYGSDLNCAVFSYRVAADAVYVGCNRDTYRNFRRLPQAVDVL